MVVELVRWCWARTMMVELVRRFLSLRRGVKLVVGELAWGLSSFCHTVTVELVQRLSSSHDGCWAHTMVVELTQSYLHDGGPAQVMFVLCSTCDLAMAARSEWWVWRMKSFALGTSTCSCLSVVRQWDLSRSPSCYINSVSRDALRSRVLRYQTICMGQVFMRLFLMSFAFYENFQGSIWLKGKKIIGC